MNEISFSKRLCLGFVKRNSTPHFLFQSRIDDFLNWSNKEEEAQDMGRAIKGGMFCMLLYLETF